VVSALSCAGALALGGRFGAALGAQTSSAAFETRMMAIEQASGGRLGVAILDTAAREQVGHRAHERFPMCSTFKVLAVGAVLARIDQVKEQLDRIVRFTKKEIVPYSPATEKRIGIEGMTIRELCAAAMTLSDNTAANLLLASIGGPSAVTAFARTLGDDITRLDRIEPDLNEAFPGDPRDTSTPIAMLSNLRALTVGNALSAASRDQLTDWLLQNQTGDKRLRAGLPVEWKVGDKTGSGERGTTNDLAIVWPPQHDPVFVSVYLTGATGDGDQRNSTIAAVGSEVANVVRK
jgi:beta-lactamase class A